MNCYPFIEAEKAQQRNVKRACELLKVSRAAYYAARDGQPCDRDRQDADLTVLIRADRPGKQFARFVWPALSNLILQSIRIANWKTDLQLALPAIPAQNRQPL